MVALLGVRDLIVVDTPDALLVAARDDAQRVGEIVKALEELELRYFASTTRGAPGCGEVLALGRARPTTANAAR